MLNLITLLPSLGKMVVETLTPLLNGASKAFVGFLSVLKDGAVDMLDNWKSIVFVLTVGVLSGFSVGTHYNKNVVPVKCQKIIKELRKDYRFVPRNTTKGPDKRSVNPWSM